LEHGHRSNPKKLQEKSSLLLTWFDRTFKELCDSSPEEDLQFLPPATKLDWYQEYKQDFPHQRVTYSWFVATWNKYYPKVRVTIAFRLTKCVKCVLFTRQLKSTNDPGERGIVKENRHDHWKYVRKERGVYQETKTRARTHPEEIVSLIIDGMDQDFLHG